MDGVEEKFHNFKVFCNSLLPDNEFVKMLQSVDLNIFLNTIKIKNGQFKSEDEIIEAILTQAQIDKKAFKDSDFQKFKRYVEYFNKVISCLN